MSWKDFLEMTQRKKEEKMPFPTCPFGAHLLG